MLEKRRLRNGKNGLPTTGKASVQRVTRPTPSPELVRCLQAVFNHWQTIKNPVKRAEYSREFVFHMTDWMAELEGLARFFRHPDKFAAKQAELVVFWLFTHALPHISAAGRIMLGELSDPFDSLYRNYDMPRKPGKSRLSHAASSKRHLTATSRA